MEELDQMENDEALKDETDSFMGNKEDWEVEYGEALESQRTEKHRFGHNIIIERYEFLKFKNVKAGFY